jgi:hypothetical protein
MYMNLMEEEFVPILGLIEFAYCYSLFSTFSEVFVLRLFGIRFR